MNVPPYPRLEQARALELHAILALAGVDGLKGELSEGDRLGHWVSSVEVLLSPEEAEELAASIRDACACVDAEHQPGSLKWNSGLDRALSVLFAEDPRWRLAPALLQDRRFWAWMALVGEPGTACSRFDKKSSERFCAVGRNVYFRCWERGRSLYDPRNVADPWHLLHLKEDQLVNIFERPMLGASPDLARSIARAAIQWEGHGDYQQVTRAALKLLRAWNVPRCIELLDEADRDDACLQAFLEVSRMKSPPAPATSISPGLSAPVGAPDADMMTHAPRELGSPPAQESGDRTASVEGLLLRLDLAPVSGGAELGCFSRALQAIAAEGSAAGWNVTSLQPEDGVYVVRVDTRGQKVVDAEVLCRKQRLVPLHQHFSGHSELVAARSRGLVYAVLNSAVVSDVEEPVPSSGPVPAQEVSSSSEPEVNAFSGDSEGVSASLGADRKPHIEIQISTPPTAAEIDTILRELRPELRSLKTIDQIKKLKAAASTVFKRGGGRWNVAVSLPSGAGVVWTFTGREDPLEALNVIEGQGLEPLHLDGRSSPLVAALAGHGLTIAQLKT